jgi:MtN3 and saliva related transmembrane protein
VYQLCSPDLEDVQDKMHCGLSGSYLAIPMLGMSLILLYALYVKNIVFIFGNGLSISLTGMLAGLWFRYRRK